MKFLLALFGLASLFFAIDASGSLQDAPPSHAQMVWTLSYTLGFLVCGAASVYLLVKLARRGL